MTEEQTAEIKINNIEEVKVANQKAQNKKDISAKEVVTKDDDISTEQAGKTEYEKSLENDVNNLEEQLAKLQKQLEEKNTDYLKLYAEFDNFRKRTSQEKDDFVKYASGNVIKDFLPVFDSFDQANLSMQANDLKVNDLKEGFALIFKQFNQLLEALNVSRIKTVGEKFDPYFHEAVAQTQETDQEEGMIVQEFRAGYLLKDKVLRHAMVVVAK